MSSISTYILWIIISSSMSMTSPNIWAPRHTLQLLQRCLFCGTFHLPASGVTSQDPKREAIQNPSCGLWKGKMNAKTTTKILKSSSCSPPSGLLFWIKPINLGNGVHLPDSRLGAQESMMPKVGVLGLSRQSLPDFNQRVFDCFLDYPDRLSRLKPTGKMGWSAGIPWFHVVSFPQVLLLLLPVCCAYDPLRPTWMPSFSNNVWFK